MVTTASYKQTFPVNASAPQPVITCKPGTGNHSDTMFSSLPAQNIWLAADQTTMLGSDAFYVPATAGTYYLKQFDFNCPAFSAPFHYAPGCMTVDAPEASPDKMLVVSPNPSIGQFKVDIPPGTTNDGTTKCQVFNMQGQLVAESMQIYNAAWMFDLTSMPCGMYTILVSTSQYVFRTKAEVIR